MTLIWSKRIGYSKGDISWPTNSFTCFWIWVPNFSLLQTKSFRRCPTNLEKGKRKKKINISLEYYNHKAIKIIQVDSPNYTNQIQNISVISLNMFTHCVTGQYSISWLVLGKTAGFLTSLVRFELTPCCREGDFPSKHTPPKAQRNPVILAHSFTWSCI